MAAKLEWGAKRTCLSCAARFYDMRREPITCPKCNTVFDPEAVFRPRRARATNGAATTKAAPKKKKAAAPVAKKVEVEPETVVDPENEAPEEAVAEGPEEDVAEGDDDSDNLIEDTSDLAEDDDGLPPAPDPDDENAT